MTKDSLIGLDLYAYCMNDPVNKFDPNGNISIDYIKFCVIVLYKMFNGEALEMLNDMIDIGFNINNSDPNKAASTNSLSFYKGKIVLKHKKDYSFAIFGIIFSGDSDNAEDIMHERDHLTQEEILGPGYLIRIAIPSLIYNRIYECNADYTIDAYKLYYSMPWEKTADMFGGVKRSSGYISFSGIISIFYFLGGF